MSIHIPPANIIDSNCASCHNKAIAQISKSFSVLIQIEAYDISNIACIDSFITSAVCIYVEQVRVCARVEYIVYQNTNDCECFLILPLLANILYGFIHKAMIAYPTAPAIFNNTIRLVDTYVPLSPVCHEHPNIRNCF
eukprot:981198_1